MKQVNWNDHLEEVKDFSAAKEEPLWMQELRLNALASLNELALPVIERAKIDRWPLTKTGSFIEGTTENEGAAGVADFSQLDDRPLLIQQDGQVVFEQLSTDLIDQGVIFTDIFTALREYPELVKEYFMDLAVKPDEDKLTAFQAAFLNSGAFLYVPKNVVIKDPVEAGFLHSASSKAAFVSHVLIVAEENSELTYLERFQTTGEGKEKITANIVVEVIAKPGAKIKFSALDQLGEHVTAYINRRGYLLRDASIDWALGVLNDGDVVADFDSDLVGNGSHAELKAVAISSGKQTQVIDTRVTNKAPYSIGHILQHGVIRDSATLTFNGIGHIIKGAKGADAQQESRVLMLSDKARGDANPILLIDENEVTAGHAASVGRVDPEEMYYLMSRGIARTEAERLVIRGFLGSVLTAMPLKAVRDEMTEVIEGKLTK